MKQSEFLKDSIDKLESHIKRIEAITEGMTDAQLSKDLDSGLWGVGRVLEHMNIANEPYIKVMRQALASAPSDSGDTPKAGFWGRTLAKIAGPEGNAPAPKQMIPEAKEFTHEVVNRWFKVTRDLIAVAQEAEGKDINRAKFKNPFIGFMKMNVTDGLTVGVAHTERHVRQIEERAKIVKQ